MANHPRQRDRRLGWQNLFAFIWLIYLLYPIASLFGPGLTDLQRGAGAAGIIVFVLMYLQMFRARWPYNGLYVLAEILLGLLLIHWISPNFAGFYVYSTAASIWLGARWRSLAGFALSVSAMATSVFFDHLGWDIALPLGVVILLLGSMGFLVSRFAKVERELEAEQARRARVEERERIARDLHDVLGHTLSLIVLKSQLASRLAREDPERAAAECADLEAAARQALDQVRTVVAGFRASPLREALQEAEQLCRAADIQYEGAEPPVLPAALDGILGLILREAVTNVARHSRARRCFVAFSLEDGGVAVTVDDDGAGFNAEATPQGNGLRGMRERLAAVGGRLEMTSRPSGGTCVRAWLPMLEGAAAASGAVATVADAALGAPSPAAGAP